MPACGAADCTAAVCTRSGLRSETDNTRSYVKTVIPDIHVQSLRLLVSILLVMRYSQIRRILEFAEDIVL